MTGLAQYIYTHSPYFTELFGEAKTISDKVHSIHSELWADSCDEMDTTSV